MKKLTTLMTIKKPKLDVKDKQNKPGGSGAPTSATLAHTNIKKFEDNQPKKTKIPASQLTKTKLTFVCISDTHRKLEKADAGCIPPGDVLLHSGDFTMDGSVRELLLFNDFLGTLQHTHKVVIAGNHEGCLADDRLQNHDSILQHYKQKHGVSRIRDLLTNCIYLEDESTVISGIKIYGAPWTPKYSSCSAFSLPTCDRLQKKWDNIPDDVDILMTHGPPRGYGDTTLHDVEAGSRNLARTVQERIKPKFHVFGHIHEGYGVYNDGTTTFINASICTRGYKPTNQPIRFEMDIPRHVCDNSLTSNGIELPNERDFNTCDTSTCDRSGIHGKHSITCNGISPAAGFCETPTELQTRLTDNDIDWSPSESDASQLNYTKLTDREMDAALNEV